MSPNRDDGTWPDPPPVPIPNVVPVGDLNRRFDLHRPACPFDGVRCGRVREAIKEAARAVMAWTPPGREQSAALSKLEEAMFYAIGAVVRPEASDKRQLTPRTS